ncbi:MAG: T9SS type A sorting domain-containing protein [Candidatus Zixiibacteriota bacterium]|nr:MAG: T9SS type A sorting domain-containing protein [candidate division Zixibacteria bacterium]
MKPITVIALAILLVCLGMSSACGEDHYRWRNNQEEPGEWTVPDCDRVIGTPALTFTSDEGLTMAETGLLKGIVYTYGLTTLDVGNTLLASTLTNAGTTILRSTDAGCNWRTIELLPVSELLLLTAAPDGQAYGWSRGRSLFYRIEGTDVVNRSAPRNIYGLAVDPDDANHIRIGTYDCQLYESFDGGVTFAPLGNPANTGNTIYFAVEFDPSNFDCALCGSKGAWRTTDAGQTWSVIPPFEKEDLDLVYLFEFNRADPGRVWARANLETIANPTREILVSSDGGASFGPAIKQGDQTVDQNGEVRTAILTNQPTMAAHSENPDLFYFVMGSYFQGYGTDLFRYDARMDDLSVVHIDLLDGIDAIAFNPADANVMYLGLESESISLTKEAGGVDNAASSGMMRVAPNPFNPTAEISFSLAEGAQVRLEVYNIAGRKVATLIDGYLTAGDHTARWDGSRVASGVYLARLQAGSTSDTKKMVLLK